MAPKKKGGKKQEDDWEAELGETVDAAPKANTTEDVDGDGDADMGGGGGLLAALKKNKNKRAKKGKPVDDFVEGDDPPTAEEAVEEPNMNSKPPATGNVDEDDVFAGTTKKNKSGTKALEKGTDEPADGGKDEEGGMKSKKEKEKEKKEREKQRKKEQVIYFYSFYITVTDTNPSF